MICFCSQKEDATTFEDNEAFNTWCRSNRYFFYKERIQNRYTIKIGWLLRIHCEMQPVNVLNALIDTGKFKKDCIDKRMEYIQYGRFSKKSKTRALHIYSSMDYMADARRILMEMYSSANDSYPMGIIARFIPNVQDSRFINTLQSRTSAE